jgi:hypothetical protein
MAHEVFVNEAVDVLVRTSQNGEVRPTSFLWRGKTHYVNDLGRQWEERSSGKTLRCFLLRTVENNTFELRWEIGTTAWIVQRAWLRDLVV